MTNAQGHGPARPGDRAILRHGRHGRARGIVSANVVEDDGETVVLWVPPDAPVLELAMPDGRLIREIPKLEALSLDVRGSAVMQPGAWFGAGVVMHLRFDEPWSVWWFFHDDGRFDGWYGNLEAPKARWTSADDTCVIDSADRELDLLFEADGTWSWKTRTPSPPGRARTASGVATIC